LERSLAKQFANGSVNQVLGCVFWILPCLICKFHLIDIKIMLVFSKTVSSMQLVILWKYLVLYIPKFLCYKQFINSNSMSFNNIHKNNVTLTNAADAVNIATPYINTYRLVSCDRLQIVHEIRLFLLEVIAIKAANKIFEHCLDVYVAHVSFAMNFQQKIYQCLFHQSLKKVVQFHIQSNKSCVKIRIKSTTYCILQKAHFI
jgi:hypothetical protein